MQTVGAGVLGALPGRGRRGRAARVPVAGPQDGALRAGAPAARAVAAARAARRRAADAAGGGRAGQRGECGDARACCGRAGADVVCVQAEPGGARRAGRLLRCRYIRPPAVTLRWCDAPTNLTVSTGSKMTRYWLFLIPMTRLKLHISIRDF